MSMCAYNLFGELPDRSKPRKERRKFKALIIIMNKDKCMVFIMDHSYAITANHNHWGFEKNSKSI